MSKFTEFFGKLNPKKLFHKAPQPVEVAVAEAPATAVKKKKRLFKYHKRMNRSLGGDIAFFAFLFIASLFFFFTAVAGASATATSTG